MTAVPSIETPRGRTQVSSRAMTRVVSAVAAQALGLDVGEITIDLDEHDGTLDVTVNVPVRALSSDNDRTETESDDGLQARAEQSQQHIRDTAIELTGVRIDEVSVRLTTSRIRLPRLGD